MSRLLDVRRALAGPAAPRGRRRAHGAHGGRGRAHDQPECVHPALGHRCETRFDRWIRFDLIDAIDSIRQTCRTTTRRSSGRSWRYRPSGTRSPTRAAAPARPHTSILPYVYLFYIVFLPVCFLDLFITHLQYYLKLRRKPLFYAGQAYRRIDRLIDLTDNR